MGRSRGSAVRVAARERMGETPGRNRDFGNERRKVEMKPYKIRMEHGRTDPSRVCITEQDQPLFSWAVAALEGERQAAYRLNVGQRGR